MDKNIFKKEYNINTLKEGAASKKPKNIELLAPAQNKECAIIATDCGADSIYIGANLFGARKNASNSLEDIEDVINYAHRFNVKVYVTINTILNDNELLEAIELIFKLHKIKADGIIFQDMGILKAACDGKLPDIKLIASTQCDIRDIQKVKFFENLNVGRVILARELSLDKIKEISNGTNIEIETFIHGALCVSYSGQCYLSHKIGKRSANKGECAQSCRKKYSLVDEKGRTLVKDKYLLSMKDFMAEDELENLIDAGVTSFKIEGRLKDINYIKNTVLFYRKALDKILDKKGIKKSSQGKVFLGQESINDKDFNINPKKTFNRGFCKYFLHGNRENIWNFDTPNFKGEFLGRVKFIGKNYFTITPPPCGKEPEIHPQDGLCCFEEGTLKGMLVNSYSDSKIYPNIMPKIKAGMEIFRNKDAKFEEELKNLKPKRRLGVNFRIYDGYMEAFDEDKNTVRLEFSKGEEAKNKEGQKLIWQNALQKTGNSDFYTQSTDFLCDKIYFLKTSEINEIRRKILETLSALRLEKYEPQKQKKITPEKYPEKEGDYRLNVHNKEALAFYKMCDCKVLETSFESGRKPLCNMQDKVPFPKERAELMRTKHCIRYALNMCLKGQKNMKNGSEVFAKNGPKELFLKDEKGAKYHLKFDCKNCEMIVEE